MGSYFNPTFGTKKEQEKPKTHPGRVHSFVDVRLVFTLVVETDPPPYNRIPNMMNLFCYPHAKLIKCTVANITKHGRYPVKTPFEEMDMEDEQAYALTKKVNSLHRDLLESNPG